MHTVPQNLPTLRQRLGLARAQAAALASELGDVEAHVIGATTIDLAGQPIPRGKASEALRARLDELIAALAACVFTPDQRRAVAGALLGLEAAGFAIARALDERDGVTP